MILNTKRCMQGLGILSLSTPTFFGQCSQYKEECIGHIQKVLFFTALPFIEVGMVGHRVSLASFIYLQDQASTQAETEDPTQAQVEDPAEAEAEFSGILGFLIMVLIVLGGGIALPYIKPWTFRALGFLLYVP